MKWIKKFIVYADSAALKRSDFTVATAQKMTWQKALHFLIMNFFTVLKDSQVNFGHMPKITVKFSNLAYNM